MEVDLKKVRGRPFKIQRLTDDPEYFKRYYHEKMTIINRCLSCGSQLTKAKMQRHMLTNKCQRLASINNAIIALN
jgi:hypothetical protein